ncbi:hypothetical protein, partial [Bacillus pumilus]|uniref:hypothetical protein n=1 Tax=Bacillus pumilus TaxID=1408 RepID=UPI001C92CA71
EKEMEKDEGGVKEIYGRGGKEEGEVSEKEWDEVKGMREEMNKEMERAVIKRKEEQRVMWKKVKEE